MQTIDILLRAQWIVPVEPANTVYKSSAIAVHRGRIVDILPQAGVFQKYHARKVIDRPQHVLLPGLVNTHTHVAMSLFRGLADDLPLMKWLNEHIWPAEQKWVSETFVRDGTELALAEMIRGGTTCFNDMYFFPEVTARVATRLGLRACVGLIVVDFPSPWAANADEYLHRGLEVYEQFRHSPLLRMAFAPHAPYTVAEKALERVSALAEDLDLPVHMHVHETAEEINESLTRHGLRPLARLDRLGLLSPRLLAVHMNHITQEDIESMVISGAHVIHCPESGLKLASGFCPVQRFLEAKINVALGTDGAASNNDLDLFGEMRTAALLAKAVANNAAAVPAMEALRMATLNGARALGLEDEIGSLRPGKAADIIAVDLAQLETQPIYHVLSQLVYATGRDKVTDVWVAGQHLLQDRRLTTLDERELLAKATAWSTRIQAAHAPLD
jgi:5-methylthioadenosine/S-adenosylhomocysteine deaminase